MLVTNTLPLDKTTLFCALEGQTPPSTPASSASTPSSASSVSSASFSSTSSSSIFSTQHLSIGIQRIQSSSSLLESHHVQPYTDEETYRARRLSLSTDFGEICVALTPRSTISIPTKAGEKLKNWFEKLPAESPHDTKNCHRIPYKIDDIDLALHLFESSYSCDWSIFKEDCHVLKVKQIINDLRTCYLEEYFSILKEEFPELRIHNSGSRKLTSDCDFAFALGAFHQSKEIQVVTRFNQLFEKEWYSPSSKVFDSNAYTMQYVMTASDPQMELKRARLQHEASLLMKLRTCHPYSWQLFKASTFKYLPTSEMRAKKAAEFEKIEKKNLVLEDRLNREILKLALSNPENMVVDNSLEKYLEIEHDARFEKTIAQEALKAKIVDKFIERRARNALHQEIKLNYESLEEQRVKLFFTLEALDEIAQSSRPSRFAEFEQTFNTQLEKCCTELEERFKKENNPRMKEKISKHIIFLRPFHLSTKEVPAVLEAFKERRQLEQDEKRLDKERTSAEAIQRRYKHILKSFENGHKLLHDETSFYDFIASGHQFHSLAVELNELKDASGVSTSEQLHQTIEQKISTLDHALDETRKRSLQLKHKYPLWDKAGCLGAEGDWLLLRLQYSNLRSMCFANEAHVSEGAFGFVVQNIQRGKHTIRSISQYVQAYREISGFFSGHQNEKYSPYQNIRAAAKYGERLIFVLKFIQDRISVLKLNSPPINLDVGTFEIFFKKIIKLKDNADDESTLEIENENAFEVEIDHLAIECNLIPPEQHLSAETIKNINIHFEEIAGALEAWIMQLTPHQRNAFYFHHSNEIQHEPDNLLKTIQDNYTGF